MKFDIRVKLSAMFFLNIFIWGAWLPLMNNHLEKTLGLSAEQAGWIQNTFAIASLTGIIFGGQLADRYFAAERFLAISNLIGGAAMLALPYQKEFWPFFAIMLVHCFFYVPTVSVANAVAFSSITDAAKDFGPIRMFGTIGWIAAGWATSFVVRQDDPSSTANIFNVAGGASILLGMLSFFLPHTPPQKASATGESAPLKALALLAVPSTLILAVATFFDSLVHGGYFFFTGNFLASLGVEQANIPRIMSIGQIMEIATMAILGLVLKRLGWRTTMIFGILGHAVRFFIYSISGPDQKMLVIASNVVHGFCYAFFFASVYIYVDDHFPKDTRSSAQGLFNLIILGLGPFVGNILWGKLGDHYTDHATKTVAYNELFRVPTGIAIFAALLLLVFFHPAKRADTVAPT